MLRTKRNFVVQADYSQLEVRIIALLSQDPVLIEWFRQGVDIHTKTAQILFDLDDAQWAEQTPKQKKQRRDMAKKGRHAADYGVTAETLWKQLLPEWPTLRFRAVTRFLDGFHALHTQLAKYQAEQFAKARKLGYIEMPLSGRRYHFHGNVEPSKVYNLPVQGTGADIINRAIEGLFEDMAINRWTGVNGYGESIVAQVHDALILQGPDPFRLKDYLHRHMEQEVQLGDYTLSFPIDCEVGWDWGNLSDKPVSDGFLPTMTPATGANVVSDDYGRRVLELLCWEYGREAVTQRLPTEPAATN